MLNTKIKCHDCGEIIEEFHHIDTDVVCEECYNIFLSENGYNLQPQKNTDYKYDAWSDIPF